MDFMQLLNRTARFHNASSQASTVSSTTTPSSSSSSSLQHNVLPPDTSKTTRSGARRKSRSKAKVKCRRSSGGVRLLRAVKNPDNDDDDDDDDDVSDNEDKIAAEMQEVMKFALARIESTNHGVLVHEANALRRKQGIRVKGDDCCAPIESFADMQQQINLPHYLAKNMRECGWSSPTPIQMQAIPIMMAGRELLATAPTGSGKTGAFILPILAKLERPRQHGIRALVMSPTRELSQQIYRQFLTLSQGCAFRIFLLSSGNAVSLGNSRKRDILIATPHRLQTLIEQRDIDLSSVEILVFDEGDQLFQPGLIDAVDSVMAACTNSKIQRALFSATMPHNIALLARTVLRDPLHITIGVENVTTALSKQRLLYCGSEAGKLIAMRNLFAEGVRPPALIFVQSKSRAQQLYKELRHNTLHVDIIDADQTSKRRDMAMYNFRCGKTWALICTDIIARGIDFKDVNCVVNFDFPQTTSSYIHRVGRTGRAGRLGEAITLFTDEDSKMLRRIADVIRRSGCDVPKWMLSLHRSSRTRVKKLRTCPPKRKRIRMMSIADQE